MHANSEFKDFLMASHVSCSLNQSGIVAKQSEIVSCCCQAVGKRETTSVEPEMGTVCRTEQVMLKRGCGRCIVCGSVSSQ